ncbi:hypothetical protein NDR87_26495 [Nocardia sp. CDC159]|uniref:Uncharacterized protein n=1 Tax=Nocardia pulmonis TaxID=2951408 RepID=A0A9X2IX43_9NOCA|nr:MULTISPECIES: hypothetical protein [Nocardia]MCM6774998.1 hypothetical protein [Nocardia pulmonis]MCM6789929.1 hypothetical protein [Nocardia sp. CDC159]
MIAAAVLRPVPDGNTSPWEPDSLLVDAALAGGVRLLELAHPDQCWLVAHLTAQGLTADEIATRVGCRVRKIRYLRADPLTIMTSRWIVADARAHAHADRIESLDRWCQSALSNCEQSTTRVRAQLVTAVDQIRNLRTRCHQEEHRTRTYRKYLGTNRPRPRLRRRPVDPDQLTLF